MNTRPLAHVTKIHTNNILTKRGTKQNKKVQLSDAKHNKNEVTQKLYSNTERKWHDFIIN